MKKVEESVRRGHQILMILLTQEDKYNTHTLIKAILEKISLYQSLKQFSESAYCLTQNS